MSLSLCARLISEGFAIEGGAVSNSCCEKVRREALTALRLANWTPSYHWRRFMKDRRIRSPWRRHALPLPLTAAVGSAVSGIARALKIAGYPSTAQLVELSAAITMQGASAQDMHTDISAGTPNGPQGTAPLVTAWLALQDVTSSMGPTIVYPRTHCRYKVRSQRLLREYKEDRERERVALLRCVGDYDIDGVEARIRADIWADRARLAPELLLADNVREHREFGSLAGPRQLLLNRGGLALMDCRVVHGGDAYPLIFDSPMQWPYRKAPTPDRILLNATFAVEGQIIEGFTYHRHGQLPKMTLGDFLPDHVALQVPQ